MRGLGPVGGSGENGGERRTLLRGEGTQGSMAGLK